MQEDTHQNKNFEEPPSWAWCSIPRAAEGSQSQSRLQVCFPHALLASWLALGPGPLMPVMAHQPPATEGQADPLQGHWGPVGEAHMCTSVCTRGSCSMHAFSSRQDETAKIAPESEISPAHRPSLARLFKNFVHLATLLPNSGLRPLQKRGLSSGEGVPQIPF